MVSMTGSVLFLPSRRSTTIQKIHNLPVSVQDPFCNFRHIRATDLAKDSATFFHQDSSKFQIQTQELQKGTHIQSSIQTPPLHSHVPLPSTLDSPDFKQLPELVTNNLPDQDQNSEQYSTSNFQEFEKLISINDHRTCATCVITFESGTEFYSHYKAVHRVERPFSCPNCDYTSAEKANLEKHAQRFHNDLLVCPICSLKFVKKEQYQKHFTEVHNKRCSTIFLKDDESDQTPQAKLSTEASFSVSLTESTAQKVTVQHASESFEVNEISRHQPCQSSNDRHSTCSSTSFEGSPRRACSNCRGICADKTDVHTKERKLFCNSCEDTSTFIPKLERQVRIVQNNETLYVCHVCQRKFERRVNFLKHLNTKHLKKRGRKSKKIDTKQDFSSEHTATSPPPAKKPKMSIEILVKGSVTRKRRGRPRKIKNSQNSLLTPSNEITVITPFDPNTFFQPSSESTVVLSNSLPRKRGRPKKLKLSSSETTVPYSNKAKLPKKSLLQICLDAASEEVTVVSPRLVTPKLCASPNKSRRETSNEVTVVSPCFGMPKILDAWSLDALGDGPNEMPTDNFERKNLRSG